MHDGSMKTLGEVVDHYSVGGRTIRHGVNAGNGAKNPNRDPLIVAARLTPREKRDLIAFLESLTDETFLANPRFANPWKTGPNAAPADRTQTFYR